MSGDEKTEEAVRYAVSFARKQVLAAIDDWEKTGKSVDQLRFRVRTMHLRRPTGNAARDEALLLLSERAEEPER